MRRLYLIDNWASIFAECEHKDDAFRMWKEMLLNNEWRGGYLNVVILLDNKIEYEVEDWDITYYIWDEEIPVESYIKKGIIEVCGLQFDSITELKKLLFINLG